MTSENPVLLALYPNSIGIGFACMQVPERLFNCGVVTVKPLSNEKLLRRAERFMNYYKPKIILLKETELSKKNIRVNKLIEDIATLSYEKGLPIYRYTKGQIKDVFEVFGASTKFEMVEKIIKMLPILESRAPEVREWYEKEHYQMGLFNAVALAVTHTHLTE